mgnify:CR=1 FL=1
MMLINGAHDDIYAILVTAVKEYQLLWRFPLALVLGIALAYGLRIWLRNLPGKSFEVVQHKKLVIALTLPVLAVLCVFVRYGGAFNYAHSINWESASTRLKLPSCIISPRNTLPRCIFNASSTIFGR